MTVIHIHIERTGGVTLQNLYEKKYPGSKILWYSVRDQLFAPFNIKTANYTKNWHLKIYSFVAVHLPIIRRILLRFRTIRRTYHAVHLEKLSQAEVIIGHFSAEQLIPFLPATKHSYRTVIRDPLVRMWSQYSYWLMHKGDIGHRMAPAFREKMTFEEFALLPELQNYQTRAIGTDISIYEYIGVTEHLKEFAIKTGLIKEGDSIPVTNNFSENLPYLGDYFLMKFKELHAKDYELYARVKQNLF